MLKKSTISVTDELSIFMAFHPMNTEGEEYAALYEAIPIIRGYKRAKKKAELVMRIMFNLKSKNYKITK